MGSSNSTRVSVKHNGTTSTSTFLQCLFTQYLHEAVITILCLQISLTVSVHDDILHHLYEGISTVVHLLSSLLAPLRSEILRSSLLTSLRNKFLRLSPLASLQSKFVLASPLASLRSNFVLASPLTSLWKIFLRCLYKDIPTVTPIPSKPEMFLQHIRGFVIIPEHSARRRDRKSVSLNASFSET